MAGNDGGEQEEKKDSQVGKEEETYIGVKRGRRTGYYRECWHLNVSQGMNDKARLLHEERSVG